MSALGPTRLGSLVRSGVRGVTEYTGMVLGIFLVQLIDAGVTGLVLLQLLSGAFAQRPILDDAVDGDLVSLLTVVSESHEIFDAIKWVMLGTIAMWMVWSWFLTGGVLAVLTERPRGRRETARTFGAGGAATFLAYARLGLISLVLHLPVLFVFGLGMGYLADAIEHAMTVRELIVPAIIGLAPAALLHVLVSTVIDYARAELTLRRAGHETLGAVRVTIRAFGYMFRRPVALVHMLLYWLVVVALWLFVGWLGHGHAMLGTGGALALFALRQAQALARTTLKIAVLSGQVDLTATRPPPPRTIATVDKK